MRWRGREGHRKTRRLETQWVLHEILYGDWDIVTVKKVLLNSEWLVPRKIWTACQSLYLAPICLSGYPVPTLQDVKYPSWGWGGYGGQEVLQYFPSEIPFNSMVLIPYISLTGTQPNSDLLWIGNFGAVQGPIPLNWICFYLFPELKYLLHLPLSSIFGVLFN